MKKEVLKCVPQILQTFLSDKTVSFAVKRRRWFSTYRLLKESAEVEGKPVCVLNLKTISRLRPTTQDLSASQGDSLLPLCSEIHFTVEGNTDSEILTGWEEKQQPHIASVQRLTTYSDTLKLSDL